MIRTLQLLFILKLLILSVSTEPYSFNEELLVETLPYLNIHFNFNFKSTWSNAKQDANLNFENYNLFPKRLGDIVSKFKIDELSLKLSQGTWKYNEWGLPILSAPSGSELWTVFSDGLTDELIDSYWMQSSRTISGLFGLSINLNENPNTVNPKSSMFSNSTTSLRYASIPNEIVCTENLTPWIKLLPCGKNKGIAKLLKNSNKLFESHYFMAGLHFKKICKNPPQCSINVFELKQTLSLVYNSELILKQNLNEQTMWSFQSLFNQKIDSICPVADVSKIYMDLGATGAVNVQPTEKVFSKSTNRDISLFDLKAILAESKDFNPTLILKKNNVALNPFITTHRYITDINERSFGLKTILKNNHNEKLTIVYFDTLPWYFRTYINSLVIQKGESSSDIKPRSIKFNPGIDRKRPHHIEIELDLDPNSVYSITFRVECAYLKWDEYPPDVNHGFYINPAVVTIKLDNKAINWPQLRTFYESDNLHDSINPDGTKSREVKLYTETLLMNLPTPDFSMPYNVICLVCTVVAIAFGSIHNFTTRKFKFMEQKSLKQKALDFLAKFGLSKKN